jgi:hypothetical protein
MDYTGTSGDDVLDQTSLKLPQWSHIYGGAGNDTITTKDGTAHGQSGNDRLVALGAYDVAAYWDSPRGIVADLKSGVVQDGFGYTDTLIGFKRLHGSAFNDTLLGTELADSFAGWGGSDYIDGRGGYDYVSFFNADASQYKITYDIQKDVVLIKNTSNTDTVTLKNIEAIEFSNNGATQLIKVSDVMHRTDITLADGRVVQSSIAGTWTPVGATSNANGWAVSLANFFYSQIKLPNGRQGLAMDGWSYTGWDSKTMYPVHMSLLEQDSSGNMHVATSKYVTNDLTNGAGSVLTADFNRDGKQDIALITHNESPLVPYPSTAYLSNAQGGFDKVTLPDSVCAHDATLFTLNGQPAIYASTYMGDGAPVYQYVNGQFVESKSQSGNNPNIGACSGVVADFNLDGILDVAVSDNLYGPGYSYTPNNAQNIGIYKLSDVQNNTGRAELVLTPYFNNKPEYASIISMNGPGQTHAYRIRSDDFNQDGRPDLMVLGGLWSATEPDQHLNVMQLYQNTSINGVMSFADKTEALHSPLPIRRAETDYSMQQLDTDGSGIASYFMAGSLYYSTQTTDGQPDNSIQDNYILLNDGTGHFYTYYHDQFATISAQLDKYYGQNNNTYGMEKRFIAYLTDDNHINFVAVMPDQQVVNGGAVLTYTFINVPAQLNPVVDYTNNVVISDRNGSKNIRTWAGNDTISTTNANSALTHIDGGAGLDTAIYPGKFQAYSLHLTDQLATLDGKDTPVHDQLVHVERLRFADESLALDLNANAGLVAKTLGAVFGKSAITNKDYAGIGLHFVDDLHYNYADLMQLAINARLGANPSSNQVVDLLYTNVVGQAPDANTRKAFADLLDNHTFTVASLGVLAADTDLNKANINLVGLAQTGLEYVAMG